MENRRTMQHYRTPGPGESLADYLSDARRERGLTWDDLVRATDLSLGTIRKIEEGRTRNPGVFTLLRLWRALDLPIEAIAGLKQPQHGSDDPDPVATTRVPELGARPSRPH